MKPTSTMSKSQRFNAALYLNEAPFELSGRRQLGQDRSHPVRAAASVIVPSPA
jgi:hypothetical protein